MKRTAWMMASALLLPSAAFFPSMAAAQPGAVVQAVPSEAAVGRLNSNLARLSRAPQDVDALLGAAQAALDLGDVQAANGFFTRANLVNPRLPAAKLGLAVVELALKQPQEAAANFDAAESLGEHARGHLADRGLAYDLTGQQAKAQRDYQAALRENAGDTKARLRYAVSLGISGKLAEAEQLLEAPLKAGDREAWRFRAFIYAMNGKPTEARNITQNVMPKGLADALDPYMVRVPLLTPAQKAAAAHYGDFPANVLRMTPPPQQVVVAAAPSQQQAAEPAKKDDGKKSRNSRDRGKESKAPPVQVAAVAPTPVQPAPSRIDLIPPPPPLSEPAQIARAGATPVRPLTSSSAPVVASAPRAPVVQPLPQPQIATPPARAAASPSGTPAQTQPFSQPLPSQAKPPAGRTLASALSSLTVPDAEKAQGTPAVDLNALAKAKADKAKKDAEAKARAEKEAKAKAEAELKKKLKDNPSRIWVQIAAGKNEGALAFDLRRFRKTYADAIGDESGWFTDWGATNRLLIGPYKKEASARAVVSQIKKAGGDAFLWESEAGEEVKKIGAK